MKNALVTGATGFLGRKLAIQLNKLGWKVTASGRNKQAGKDLASLGIAFFPGDLRNKAFVESACEGQHIVFHCAALSSPWGSAKTFYECNIDATRHITEGCLNHRVDRLIHVSTPSVYFGFDDRMDIKETDPLPKKPANLYAATKLGAEKVVNQAYKQGLFTVTLRPRAIFGPGDQAIFPRLIKVNQHGGIPLFRQGNIWMDITYVDNVVDALLLAAEAPLVANGKAYNITNQQPVLFKNVLSQLFTELNVPLHLKNIPYTLAYTVAASLELKARLLRSKAEPKFTRYSVAVLAKHQTLNNDLSIQQLGYKPAVSIEEGFSRFAKWWGAHDS